jgi:hypothetical protein
MLPALCILLFIYINFFVSTGILTQGFPLARQVLYLLTHSSSPLSSGYFGDSTLLLVQAGLDQNPLIRLPIVTGMTSACQHTQFFFLLSLGLTNYLPVAGLRLPSSQTQPPK